MSWYREWARRAGKLQREFNEWKKMKDGGADLFPTPDTMKPATFDLTRLKSMAFGDIVKSLRVNAGISQSALGEFVGMDSSGVSRLESGQMKGIRSDKLVGLCIALNVSADYLLGLSGTRDVTNLSPVERDVVEMLREMTPESQALTRDMAGVILNR